MVRRVVCTLVFLGAAVPLSAQNLVTVTEPATVWLRATEQSIALETLAAGARIEVVPTASPDPQWHRVKLPGLFPRLGYLSTRFTATTPAATNTPPPATAPGFIAGAPAPVVAVPIAAVPLPPPAPAPIVVPVPAASPSARVSGPSVAAPVVVATAVTASVPGTPPVIEPAPVAPKTVEPVTLPGTAAIPASPLPKGTSGRTSTTMASVDVGLALSRGRALRGGMAGLVLTDVGQGFAAAIASLNRSTVNTSSGFSLRVYTPQTWATQLVSESAKEYREVDADMFSPADFEAVLRVRVYPDTPSYVTASGIAGTSSVRHVVIRDAQRKAVIQPTFTETWSDEVSNAMGGKKVYVGLEARFNLDDLKRLRGSANDQEFFITVIGTTGEEKDFRVKKKHFDRLPIR